MTKIVSKGSFLELQKYMKLHARNLGLVFILLLTVVILLSPYFLRERELPTGEESYYYLTLARDILSGKISFFESLKFGFSSLVAVFGFVFGLSVEEGMQILLVLLGLLNVILFYLVLKKFKEERILACLFLLFSPAFIYLFNVGSIYSVVSVLALLIVRFVINKSYVKLLLCYLAVLFFDVWSFVFFLVLLFIYFLYIKRKRLVLFVFMVFLFLTEFLIIKGINFNFISDFGNYIGLSVFAVFLVLLGLFFRKRGFLYVSCLVLFLFYLKFVWVLFYLNIVFSVLVALCFIELFRRGWESNLIKNLTLILLASGLIFSGISYIDFLAKDIPSEEFVIGVSKIPNEAIVLSSVKNKYRINYFEKEFVSLEEEVVVSENSSLVNGFMDRNNVDYVLIDRKMRKEIWNNEEEGLLWLLKYSEKFKEVYSSDEIWILEVK